MVISSVIPSVHEEYSHQTKLSDVTDEEFDNVFSQPKFKWSHRLYQFLCFILFLGPIRLLVGVICFSFCMIIVYFTRVGVKFLGLYPHNKVIDAFCVQIIRIGFRFLFFAFGVIWIQVNGKIDNEARFVISNHVSLIDLLAILILRNVTFVISKDFPSNSFFRTVCNSFEPFYVSKLSSGVQKQIIDNADDNDKYPVLLFPEGTTTNGEALLQFQKQAFLTPYKVQPMLIRYSLPLVPPGWNTVSYTNQSILGYIWQLISLLFCIIYVDAIQSISMEAEGKADIDTFTTNAQIIFANHLKTKAISRSKDDIPNPKDMQPLNQKNSKKEKRS